MRIIYKTWFKAVAALLCIILLTAGVLSAGLLMILQLSGNRDINALCIATQESMISDDLHEIFNGHFVLGDKHMKACNDNICTGKNTNFRYEIYEDGVKKPCVSTLNGEKTGAQVTQDYQTVGPEENGMGENLVEVSTEIVQIGSRYYAYQPAEDSFIGWEYDEAGLCETETLDYSAMKTGFLFAGERYEYDREKDVFLVSETYQQEIRQYTVKGYVVDPCDVQDKYSEMIELFGVMAYLMPFLPWTAGIGIMIGLVLLVLLCMTAGLDTRGGTPKLTLLHRIPGDLTLIALFFLAGATLSYCMYLQVTSYSWFLDLVIISGGTFLCAITGVYTVVSFVARLRNHAVFRTTLCAVILRWLKRLVLAMLKVLPTIWKVIVVWAGLCLVELCLFAIWNVESDAVAIWFLEKLVLTGLLGYVTWMLLRLKKGAEAIAAGDYDHPVEDRHMVLDLKNTADTLNHIRGGMTAAVESRMRSERMKTELITNVSHDIKTPVTAITAYVELLKQEPAGSEKATEYIAVLDRQSQRLKRLTEDLVEASKAATGNVEVSLESIDAAVLAEQALGEYSTRLQQAGVEVVYRRPERDGENLPIMVMADGRHLWRVFDNLLSNVSKYAMPGTRLYVEARGDDGNGTMTFRNISREPLNLNAEELQERFVRGDSARHTEGSGLGLSIARSLTDAMGGSFTLSVDGDLFKVSVSLPKADA